MMGWLHRILQHNWILKECSGTARGLPHQQQVAEILVPIIGISRNISLMRTPPLSQSRRRCVSSQTEGSCSAALNAQPAMKDCEYKNGLGGYRHPHPSTTMSL